MNILASLYRNYITFKACCFNV